MLKDDNVHFVDKQNGLHLVKYKDVEIGIIRLKPEWQRFVFCPYDPYVFDMGILMAIMEKLEFLQFQKETLPQ